MATTFMEPGTDATQDFTMFAASSGATTSATDQAYTGPRSIKMSTGNPAAGCGARTPSGSASPAGTRFSARYRWSAVTPSINVNLAMGQVSGALNTIGMQLRTDSTIGLNIVGVGQSSTGLVVKPDTWYRLSYAFTITSTTVWKVNLYVDGVLYLSVDSTGTLLNGSDVNGINIVGGAGLGNDVFQWVDDVYMDNVADYTDPGDIRVTAKRPFANGTTNGFTTQIGSGGSGYGSGHAPQVNEQPLSAANGWSMVGAGAAVTEDYSIEGMSAGDQSLVGMRIVDHMGWVYASSLASQTAQIKVSGATSNISLTSTNTSFQAVAGSSAYPLGGTDIGIVTATDLTTVSLYECGVMFAFVQDRDLLSLVGAG